MALNEHHKRALRMMKDQQKRFEEFKAERLPMPEDMLEAEFFERGYESYILARIALHLRKAEDYLSK